MPGQEPPTVIDTPTGKLILTHYVRAIGVEVISGLSSTAAVISVTSPDDARKAAAAFLAWADTQSTTPAPRTIPLLPPDILARVSSIPGADGWWKSASGEAYVNACADLMARGWSADDAIKLLASLYRADEDCHGGT